MPKFQKNYRGLVEETIITKLSPLQQKIVLELCNGPLCLNDLSERTGSSVHTIGKQLSILGLKTEYNPLSRKGISKPVVKKNKAEGVKTTYFINPKLPSGR